MKNINQVTLLGNITKDPVLKYIPSGDAVINFSIATNRSWIDKTTKEKKEVAEFHNIVFWGKVAELINQYSGKGSRILVQGRLQTRSWEKDGVKRYITEIVGNDFVIFDKKEGVTATETQAEPNGKEEVDPVIADYGIQNGISYAEAKAQLTKPPENAPATATMDPSDLPF